MLRNSRQNNNDANMAIFSCSVRLTKKWMTLKLELQYEKITNRKTKLWQLRQLLLNTVKENSLRVECSFASRLQIKMPYAYIFKVIGAVPVFNIFP